MFQHDLILHFYKQTFHNLLYCIFEIGATFAVLKSGINSPQANERLNTCVRAINILSGVLFKIVGKISSIPVLF